MELIATMPPDVPLTEVAAWAQRAERLGLDTVHVTDTVHDPFVTSALALEHTERLRVRTSMVVAFPRSPMTTAYAAWDLARFSGGRFELGIASQVRGNIVDRYSATWTEPVGQLRDYIASLRAIFCAFQTGAPLHHEGEHYRFTRLQPYFNPGPMDHDAPSIWSGGVNTRMCALAGEASDGFVCHPTASHPRYVAQHVLPAVRSGVTAAGRTDGGPSVVLAARPLMGRTADEVAGARDAYRSELAFLYTTPAYARQLEFMGLTDLGPRLSSLVAEKRWDDLTSLVTDEVMDQFVPSGVYSELPAVLANWYSGRAHGITVSLPASADHDPDFREVVLAAREIPTLSTSWASKLPS